MVRHRTILLLVAATLAGCELADAPEQPPADDLPAEASIAPALASEVIAVAQAVLDAINTSDPDLLRTVMLPDARIVANGDQGGPRTSTVEQMAAQIGAPPQIFTERMWDPEVRVDGALASVWAPYDFYRDGEFSHCGVDAFHLVRVDERWRVQNLAYTTRQPPDCERHPDGPPAGR